MENLKSLFNQLPMEGRVDMRQPTKNKNSGSLRFLFTFLDLTLVGGIQDLGTNDRDALRNFIAGSFTLMGAEINPNTFYSSYSRWNKMTKKNGYSDLRKRMAKALGSA